MGNYIQFPAAKRGFKFTKYRLTQFHQSSCSVGCQVSFPEGKGPGFEGENIPPTRAKVKIERS
jgi:hypothetical protein